MSNPPQRLRIVVADDHNLYRQGLADILARAGIDVVAQAANGRDAIEAVVGSRPDVIVMDLQMPGMSGLEAIRRLGERVPGVRVLVLTVSTEEADVSEALLSGACGYLLKDGSMDEVVRGIRAAAQGDALISPRVANTVLDRIRERERVAPHAPPVPLSDREREVLALLAEGMANPEIAELLCIEQTTVRNHVSSILTKLQVDNRVQAAVRAVRDRLV